MKPEQKFPKHQYITLVIDYYNEIQQYVIDEAANTRCLRIKKKPGYLQAFSRASAFLRRPQHGV